MSLKILDNSVRRVLDLSRWSPSPENAQPWRFEIVDSHSIILHKFYTRDMGIYDCLDHAMQFTMGILLETIRIASNSEGLEVNYNINPFDFSIYINFKKNSNVKPNDLSLFIKDRVTNRGMMSTRPLSYSSIDNLENSLKPYFDVRWFDSTRQKLLISRLNMKSSVLRLSSYNAYKIHKDIIEWNVENSKDRIPDNSLGLNRFSIFLTKWILQDWNRVRFFNKIFIGTLLPSIELDLIPGMFCGSHFAIISKNNILNVEDRINSGAVFMRFWLTASKEGLFLHPSYTPIIFSNYIINNYNFSNDLNDWKRAKNLCGFMEKIFGSKEEVSRVVMLGRIGYGKIPFSRSIRFSLEEQIKSL